MVRLGDRLCDLSYANPYGGTSDAVRAALRAALDEERSLDLQYTPFGGATIARRLAADALRAATGLPFTFRHVVLTPGAMAALHLALRTAGEPGDEVVVPVPCWLDHPLYVRACERVPVLVPAAGPDLDLDLDAVRAALGPRTAAVLVTHPGNPTGRLLDAGTLVALGDVLAEAEARHGRPITLIADETHRDFTAPGAFRSATGAWPRTVVVYSYGKYHFIQGQRLGYAACSPEHPDALAVADEMIRWVRLSGLATPTALMQRALPRLQALRHDASAVDAWRTRVGDALEAAGHGVVRPDGTLFVYVRTPGDEDDFAFVARMARSGVLVMPAPVFHHRGHFRLALTGSEAMLERALPVLAAAAA